jgi:hypothetical protein
MQKLVGRTEPRLCTRPLRELTPETSLGFEVIEFALEILDIDLYPWQQRLLIHALELLPDGQYRFRRVIILVARQEGRTTIASVHAAWWLFVDSARHPERVPPLKFKVVGVAQDLDIAREPWAMVKLWCDPKPETDEGADLAIAALQAATANVVDTNGKEAIVAGGSCSPPRSERRPRRPTPRDYAFKRQNWMRSVVRWCARYSVLPPYRVLLVCAT